MLRFFFGDELLVYVVVVLVCFFGKHESAITAELYRRLPQKRYYSASVSSEQQQQEQQQQRKQTTSFADLGVPKQIVDLLRNAGIEAVGGAISGFAKMIDPGSSGKSEEDAKAWRYLCHRLRCNRTRVGKTLAYLIPIFCDILREEEAMEKMIEIKEARERCSAMINSATSQELAVNREDNRNVLGRTGKILRSS